MEGLLLGVTSLGLACAGPSGGGSSGDDNVDDEEESTSSTPATETTAETGEESGSSSGSLPIPDGVGCDITPTCDKGQFIGSIDFTSSDQIEEIQGYTSLTGYLYIHDVADIECVDFLACLEGVGHDIQIYGNPRLQDLSGFDNLEELGFATADRPRADWDGTLTISKNGSLVQLNGFNKLPQVQQSLSISDNAVLEAIVGFSEFRAIQFDLSIRQNPSLRSIEGLSNLAAVGGSFSISNNPELCLSDINELGGNLQQGPCAFPSPTCGASTAANKTDC